MIVSVLTTALYRIPGFLLLLAAFGVAAWLLPRNRTAGGLLFAASTLQILASIIGFAQNVWMMNAAASGDYQATEIGMVSGAIGIVTVLADTVGQVLLLATIVAAARGGVAKSTVDPYGFTEKG